MSAPIMSEADIIKRLAIRVVSVPVSSMKSFLYIFLCLGHIGKLWWNTWLFGAWVALTGRTVFLLGPIEGHCVVIRKVQSERGVEIKELKVEKVGIPPEEHFG